jgi:hypothetical protein
MSPHRTRMHPHIHGWLPLLALGSVQLLSLLASNALSWRAPYSIQVYAGLLSLGIALLMFAAALLAWWEGWRRRTRRLVIIFTAWVTIGMLFNTILLIVTLPQRIAIGGSGLSLLSDAIVVWVSNILIFSVIYWFFDSGGPEIRHITGHHPYDFIFPQQANQLPNWQSWQPHYIDYLFLAFNTSSAFSPTDTLILSHRMKLLTMLQSILSLTVIATLAAFAVNILASSAGK